MIYLGADNHKPASAIVIRVDQAVGEHFAHGLVNRCNSANVRSDDEVGNTDGISGDTQNDLSALITANGLTDTALTNIPLYLLLVACLLICAFSLSRKAPQPVHILTLKEKRKLTQK